MLTLSLDHRPMEEERKSMTLLKKRIIAIIHYTKHTCFLHIIVATHSQLVVHMHISSINLGEKMQCLLLYLHNVTMHASTALFTRGAGLRALALTQLPSMKAHCRVTQHLDCIICKHVPHLMLYLQGLAGQTITHTIHPVRETVGSPLSELAQACLSFSAAEAEMPPTCWLGFGQRLPLALSDILPYSTAAHEQGDPELQRGSDMRLTTYIAICICHREDTPLGTPQSTLHICHTVTQTRQRISLKEDLCHDHLRILYLSWNVAEYTSNT